MSAPVSSSHLNYTLHRMERRCDVCRFLICVQMERTGYHEQMAARRITAEELAAHIRKTHTAEALMDYVLRLHQVS